MSKADPVNVVEGPPPADYHCDCEFCVRSLGELRPSDGTYYSRLERNQYYDKSERGDGGHIAKTPLHIARWLVQTYTKPGDWVLDPTIGAGTTAVESITQGRNVAGMEVQFAQVLRANVSKNKTDGVEAKIRIGDARRIGAFLDELGVEFSLVYNNPPYSGDESPKADKSIPNNERRYSYKDNLPNLAFLKEGKEYYDTMAAIYGDCIKHLKVGGHFAYGIKDMVLNRKPKMLHQRFNEVAVGLGLEPVGTAFLLHHPKTFHLNRYFKTYGAHPPYYQTIGVFKKVRR